MRRQALKILGVYVGLGPLIGLLVFATGMLIVNADPSQSAGPMKILTRAIVVFGVILVVGLLFAHLMGAPWALLAAVVAIAVYALWKRPSPWIGPLSGVPSFAAAMVIGSKPTIDPGNMGEVALTLLIHLIAATASWTIACRWIRRSEARETSPPASKPAETGALP